MATSKLFSAKGNFFMRLNTIKSALFIISLVFVFLGTSDIFSLSGVFLLLASACLLGFSMISGNIRLDLYLILVVIFSVVYSIIVFAWQGFSVNIISNFIISPISFYLFSQSNGNNKKNICAFLLCFVLGYLLRAFILLFTTIINQGYHFVNFLTGIDWYSGNTVYISRNGLSLFFVPFFVISLPFIFEKNNFKKWWIVLFAVVVDLIAIISSIIVGNRALIVCIFIWFIAQFLITFAKIQNKKIFYSLFISLFVLVIVFFLIFIGVIPLPNSLLNIYGIRRLIEGGSNSERMSFYVYFVQNFWRYPFGGMYNNLGRYLHNFYLDIYNFGGLIPFLLFSFFLVVFVLDSKHVLNKKYYFKESETTRYVLWMFVGLFTLGMIEPIFQTDNIICSIIFFCFGYMRGLSSKKLFAKNTNQFIIKGTFTEINI